MGLTPLHRLVTERSPTTHCVVNGWRSRNGQECVKSPDDDDRHAFGPREHPTGTMARVAAPDGQGAGFGANSWLVEEMYEQFVDDPASVSESWREFFADYHSQAPSVAAAAATSPAVQAVVEAHRPPSDETHTNGNGASAAPAAAPRSGTCPGSGSGARSGRGVEGHGCPGRRARLADPRRRRRDRTQHGGQPRGPDGDQLPQRAGQAARGQPQGDQRLPVPHRPDQDQLHPPDRLGHRPRHRRCGAGDEEHLRAGRRRQAPPRRARARQHEPGGRQGEARREPHAARARDPRLRHARLQRLPRRVRGDHPQGQHQQADRRRLPGCEHQPHQPRRHRHRPVGPAPDARPGCHRRRRQHRLPSRVRRFRSPQPELDRRQQGRHDHHHLRPPHHPGCRVRPLPEARARAAARRTRLLRGRLPGARHAVRGRQVAPRHLRDRSRRGDARQADGRRQADPRVPGARPPDGRPRPAALEGAVDPARARSGHLRPHDLGPRPRVPHRRRRRGRQDAPRGPARRAARRVLPHHRCRVHAHPEHRRAAVDPGAVRGSPTRGVQGSQAPDPRAA